MNIIEAIKSGKPFRKKNEWCKDYFTLDQIELRFKGSGVGANGCWLEGEEFEIQEKTITITESQFDEAWGEFLKNTIGEGREATKDVLKKELGFN